jgi:hypothetical protein
MSSPPVPKLSHEKKKFAPGEYVVTRDRHGNHRVAVVIHDEKTTLAPEVRIRYVGTNSQMDVWVDACRVASRAEIYAARPAPSTQQTPEER